MNNKHLPRLFAQALNEKRVELFDEFIHPEYTNHNAYVERGPAGVKAFFRHYLDAFPDTKVVMDDVIEEGDRISARFTYNGTFRKPFMGYQPNSAAVQMRSIDIWRVRDSVRSNGHPCWRSFWKAADLSAYIRNRNVLTDEP